MPGVYGGLILIIVYGVQSSVTDDFFLITQDGDPILTNTGQTILVQQ